MPRKKTRDYDDMMVDLLARGHTQAEVAALCECSISTVQRRLKDPDFSARISQCRAAMFDGAVGKLSSIVEVAAKTLCNLLDEKNPLAIQLNASKTVFELFLKSRDFNEVDKRLCVLESKVNATAAAETPNRA